MVIEDIQEADRPHYCKPFRISELIIIIFCFILLFFLRQFDPEDPIICSSKVLTILFTCNGSTLLITFIDVACQALRKPIPNIPMILGLLLAISMSFTSGITAVLVHSRHENSKSRRNLNSLCLLAGSSFLASLLYVLDILFIREAKRKQRS